MSTFLAIYSMICYWLSLVSLDIIIVSPEVKRGCLKLIEFMSITNTTVLSIPSGVFISSSVSGYHLTSDRWLDAHTVTLYCSTLGKKKKNRYVEDTCNKEPSICAHTKYRKIRLQRDNLSLGD